MSDAARITYRPRGPSRGVIVFEGRLTREAGEELLRVAESCISKAELELDIAGMSSADEGGLAAIAGLRTRGILVRGASLYIARLFEEHTA